jgi:uncharacterized repeat protein (TIGR01451 family)
MAETKVFVGDPMRHVTAPRTTWISGSILFFSLVLNPNTAAALFTNGGFETGDFGGWTKTAFFNFGLNGSPPFTGADIVRSPGASDQSVIVTGSPGSQVDPQLGPLATLRYPKYGSACARVNGPSAAFKANTIKQQSIVTLSDIDPVDGLVHIRFEYALVLQDPPDEHPPEEEPFFYVSVRNIDKGNALLYEKLEFSSQLGIPWQTSPLDPNVLYTDWQLVDCAPDAAALQEGDNIELEVIAAGCGQGAHWGYVYVDGFGSSLPGLGVTKTAPLTVPMGGNLTYTFKYQNGGNVTADNVIIKETIPACAAWVSNSDPSTGGTCTYTAGSPGVVICDIGMLAPNASGTFSVTVTASADPYTCLSITNGNYTIEGTGLSPTLGPPFTTTILGPAPLVTKTAPAVVQTGENLTYTFTYQNVGTTAADGIVVTEAIPDCATWVATSNPSTGGTCTFTAGSPGVVTCDIGTLAPNASGTFSVTVTASADPIACPSIDNANYAIEGTGISPRLGPLVHTTIQALAVAKTAPATVPTGQQLTYTFSYQNDGSAAASSVVVKETIPACATWVSNTPPTTGGSCGPPVGGVVTCNLGTLDPGELGTFTIKVTASTDPVSCTSIENGTYSIQGAGAPPVPGESVSTSIQAPPQGALSVSKTAPATVTAGQNVTYVFTYQNSSGATASSVVVEEAIPACATWVSNSDPSTGGTCTYANGVVTCAIGTLGPNASGTFSVTVTASADPACASIENETYGIVGTGLTPNPGPLVSTTIQPPAVHFASWFHDAFPFNGTAGLPGTPPFDTTTAVVKTGLNIAQVTGNDDRLDIPADTLVARSAGTARRMDLVFRILPGPGNYMTVGNRSSGLRRLPCQRSTGSTALCSAPVSVVANNSSTNFWESYLADGGAFGTGGNGVTGIPHDPDGPDPIAPGTQWDPNHWNSARMDTAEANLFPTIGHSPNLGQLTPGAWASMYHEADPRYATLGIAKNRCFLVDPAVGSSVDETNVTCGDGVYPPAWTSISNSGYTVEIPGQPGMTREYTKIIPDGHLTPGSHVQYFIRSSVVGDPPGIFSMIPDTTMVYPQPVEGSLDGHRWQQFGVLPDRWKAIAFGGSGMAPMLFVDLNDGHGDEMTWVEAAEVIGATANSKRGAHNGWSRGAQFSAPPNDPTNFVRHHGGQPGSVWDMYGVRGVDAPLSGHAGSIGSRLAKEPAGSALNKGARIGPTLEMLITYYCLIYILSGDYKERLLGPDVDRSQNDLSMLQDFLATPGSAFPHATANPRRLFIEGESFVESNWSTLAHKTFLTDYLGVSYVAGDYSAFANNPSACPTLDVGSVISPPAGFYGGIAQAAGPEGDDVLDVSGLPGATIASTYPNTVQNPNPKIASVYKAPAPPLQNWAALTDGWDIKRLTTQTCPAGNDAGRRKYLFDVLKNVMDSFCQRTYQVTGDVVSDNHVMLFTAPNEGPQTTPVYTGFRSCWPTPTAVNLTTTDRYLYLACWGDDAGGQGLLHDLRITTPTGARNVFSGDALWSVAPTDSNVGVGCGSPSPSAQMGASLASRIPGATFGTPALGCFNPPTGMNCYGIWGPVSSIDPAARWTWFNSGLQGGANAPFQPGFNHREFLIFRLDMQATEFVTAVEPGLPAFTGLRITPNPSRNPIITFVLEAPSMVELAVYDVTGRRVKGLHKGMLPPGPRSVQWSGEDENGSRARPGVYFVRLKMGDVERKATVVMLE